MRVSGHDLEQAVYAVAGVTLLRALERAHAGAFPSVVFAELTGSGEAELVADAEHEPPAFRPVPYDWDRDGL
jgi:hypothetical protein